MNGVLFSPLIERAMRVAACNHRHHHRKSSDLPYITHPAGVALILLRAGFDDEELLAAALLHDVVAVPETAAEASSVWAQYTVLLDDRDALRINLAEAGVATAVYYPRPLHRQTAYRDYPRSPSGLSISERLSEQVLSLPMHPYLDELTQDKIVDAVRGAVGKG